MGALNKIKQLFLCILILTCTSCANLNPSCTNSCTDDDITTSVQIKINVDRCMSDQFIHVTTYERVVTLSGSVSNPTQKRIATQMAQSVPGVKAVRNKLVVKPID